MKKYLVGEYLHLYEYDKGLSWILLDGEGDFALVTGIGYMFSTTSYVKTVCAPGRCVWETSAFIKTDKYINPEYPQPTLNIPSVTINDELVNTSPSSDVIRDPDWIWETHFRKIFFMYQHYRNLTVTFQLC